jgi:hypothetical protein
MKPLRKGEFVKANVEAGEFILDTSDPRTCNKAACLAIAKRLAIKGATQMKDVQLFAAISEKLLSINLPEINKMTETDKTLEIVKAGKAANQSDDEIIIAIVQSGIGYKKALNAYKSALETLGLIKKDMPKKDRDEAIAKALAKEKFAATEYQAWSDRAEKFVASMEGVTFSGAYASIKAYAKEHELEAPKKPKGAKVGSGSQIKKLVVWMLNNLKATEEQWAAHCNEINLGKGRQKSFGEIFKVLQENIQS